MVQAKRNVVGNVTPYKIWNKFQVENLSIKSCNNLYFDQFLVESCLFPCSPAFQHLLSSKLLLHTRCTLPFRNSYFVLVIIICCLHRRPISMVERRDVFMNGKWIETISLANDASNMPGKLPLPDSLLFMPAYSVHSKYVDT